MKVLDRFRKGASTSGTVLSLALILVAVVLQVLLSIDHWYRPLRGDLNAVAGATKIERSLRLAFGPEVAEYVLFVRGIVPESATVLLPPSADEPVLGHAGLMQYSLYPRRVTNCPRTLGEQDCLSSLPNGEVYILQVGAFPRMSGEELSLEHKAFDEGRGLLLPRASGEEGG